MFDARMSSLSVESEQASTMKHGRDLDDVMSQTVDDSVVPVDDLANRLVSKLRHDTSGSRVVRESFHGGDEPLDKKVSVVRGVAADMRADRLDVLDCLWRPDDLGHRRRRRFASV